MTQTYRHTDFQILAANFRANQVTIATPDQRHVVMTIGDLRAAAEQDDAALAMIYRRLLQMALYELATDRIRSVRACSGHQAQTTTDEVYNGSGDYPPAHGNITRIETCRCGAECRR